MIRIRNAQSEDLASLCAVRYPDQPAIHRDRVLAADQSRYFYLVAELDEHLVGFAVLLMEPPPDWSDPLNSFPIVVDLFVTEAYRNRGVGQALIQQIEVIATAHGKPVLYLSVEPFANPRALAFYTRLGFVRLQDHPYHNIWHFRDSDGQLHTGEEWVIDMRKSLCPDIARPAAEKGS